MGAGCSGDRNDGAAYSDRLGGAGGPQLSPEQLHALVQDKLRHSLFSGLLSVPQLADFARYFQVRYYPAGSTVLKKGAVIDALFVVGEGQVRMEVGEEQHNAAAAGAAAGGGKAAAAAQRPGHGYTLSQTNGNFSGTHSLHSHTSSIGGNLSSLAGGSKSNLLCLKNIGDHFGESMLLEDPSSSSPTASGQGPTSEVHVVTSNLVETSLLLVLPRERFLAFLREHPEDRALASSLRSLGQSMESSLASLDFFRGMPVQKMKLLQSMFQWVALMEGGVLFRENDFDRERGNSLFFLYKGRVRVSNAERKPTAMLAFAASNASEQGGAPPPSSLMPPPHQLTASSPSDAAATLPAFLSNAPPPTGSASAAGSASSPLVEEKTLNTLESGCFLGEVGLMMDIPRTATITALESSLLLELSQSNFRHFITLVPEILEKFNAVLLEYNIHLRYFIHNPLVLNYFIQHCRSEHSSENIDFWMAVREVRRLDPEAGDQDEINTRAREIQRMYIGPQAEHQVNLKHSVEAKTMRGLAQYPRISNLVFAEAEEEILGLMSSDSFGRFKSSELFAQCIETVNSPYTAILRKLFLI